MNVLVVGVVRLTTGLPPAETAQLYVRVSAVSESVEVDVSVKLVTPHAPVHVPPVHAPVEVSEAMGGELQVGTCDKP